MQELGLLNGSITYVINSCGTWSGLGIINSSVAACSTRYDDSPTGRLYLWHSTSGVQAETGYCVLNDAKNDLTITITSGTAAVVSVALAKQEE